MAWFGSEFKRQLSEFAQDLLANDPEEGEPITSSHPRAFETPRLNAFAPSPNSVSEHPSTLEPSVASNSEFPPTQPLPNLTYSGYASEAQPTWGDNSNMTYGPEQPHTFQRAYPSNPPAYAAPPSFAHPQPYGHQVERYSSLPSMKNDPALQAYRDEDKDKLYALIHELELKNHELEVKLKTSAAQQTSRDDQREAMIQPSEAKLPCQAEVPAELNLRRSPELMQAQLNETSRNEDQARYAATEQTLEGVLPQPMAPDLSTPPSSEDKVAMKALTIRCQNLAATNGHLQIELTKALAALRRYEATPAEVSSPKRAQSTEAEELKGSAGAAGSENELEPHRTFEDGRNHRDPSSTEAYRQSLAEFTKLRGENDRLNAEKGMVEQALAHCQQNLAALKQQLADTLEAKDASYALAQQLEAKVRAMTDQLATLHRRWEEGEQHRTHLEQQSDALKDEVQRYKDELEATRLDLEGRDNKSQDMHQLSQSLQEALGLCAQREQALKAVQSEVDDLEKLNRDSELQISQLKGEKEKLELNLEKFQKDHAHTTEGLEASVQSLNEAHMKDQALQSKLEERIQELATKETTQLTEIQRLQQAIAEVSEQAKANEELAKSSQTTIDRMKAEAEEKQIKIADSEAKLRELEFQRAEACMASDSTLQSLHGEISELKQHNESANRTACHLQEQLVSSQLDLKAKAHELHAATEALDALKEANAQLTSKVDSLVEELSTAKAASAQLEAEAQQLRVEKTALLSALEDGKGELEALKLKEDQSHKAYQQLRAEMEATQELANQAQSSLEVLKAENVKLVKARTIGTPSEQDLSAQEKLLTLEKEKLQLEQQITQLESQASCAEGKAAQLQEELASFETRLTAEADRLASELEHKAKTISDLRQQVADQKTQLAAGMDAWAQIEPLKASQASLTKELAEKVAQSDALEERLENTLVAMVALQNKADQLDPLQQQLDATLATMRELQLNQTALESAAHEAAELKDKLEASQQQLETTHQSLEALTAKFEHQAHAMTEQQKQLDEHDSLVAKLNSSLQALSSEKAALAAENDQLINNLNSIKVAVKAKLQEIEGENSKLLRRIEILEGNHAELNRTYEAALAKLQTADKERSQLQSQINAMTSERQAAQAEVERLYQQLDQTSLNYEAFASETSFQRKELEARVQALEELLTTERKLSKEAAAASAKACADLELARAELDALRQDYASAQTSLIDLQGVLEELQGAQSAEVDFAVEKLQREAETQAQLITELEYRAALAETKLSDYSRRAERAEARANALQEQAAEGLRLKDQMVSLNDQNLELTRRLRKLGNSEELISREFVAGLFTRFASFPRGDPRKYEMLEVISGALRLSPEEQVEVGLVRDVNLAYNYASLRAPGQTVATVTSPPINPTQTSEPPQPSTNQVDAMVGLAISPTQLRGDIGNL